MKVDYEGELYEELLCPVNLMGKTPSYEIFEALNSYFREYEIDGNNVLGYAANMTGHLSGIVAKVKNIGQPDILSKHCIIHREQLETKQMSLELHKVLSNVTEIIKEFRN